MKDFKETRRLLTLVRRRLKYELFLTATISYENIQMQLSSFGQIQSKLTNY